MFKDKLKKLIDKDEESGEGNDKKKIENLVFFVVLLIITIVIINIILEVVIGLLNLYAFSKNLRPASTKIGKIKTVFLFVLLGILYLSKVINISNIYLFIFIILTIILQIITIFSYLSQIKKRKITINSSL